MYFYKCTRDAGAQPLSSQKLPNEHEAWEQPWPIMTGEQYMEARRKAASETRMVEAIVARINALPFYHPLDKASREVAATAR